MDTRQLAFYYEACQIAQSRGFKVLSCYIDAKTKMKFSCPNGHEFDMIFGCFKRGQGCSACSGIKKHTIEEVRETASIRGYTLLSTIYVNNATPMELLCPEGHYCLIEYRSFSSGCGCAICSRVKKYTIEQAREIGLRYGFTLLETEYVNARTSMKWLCKEGHRCGMCLAYLLLRKSGCATCSGTKKYTIEQAREIGEERGFTLHATTYINNWTPMDWSCHEGHMVRLGLNSLLQRITGCAICSGRRFHTLEKAREISEERGFTLLSTEYRNNRTHMNFCCKQGHIFKATFAAFLQGSGCRFCKTSKGETAVSKILKSFALTFKAQARIETLQSHFFDFMFDYGDEKYLVEYDGKQHFEKINHFHRFEGDFEARRHTDGIKTRYALLNNYRLIRIDYHEKDNIEKHISAALSTDSDIYLSTPEMYEWLKPYYSDLTESRLDKLLFGKASLETKAKLVGMIVPKFKQLQRYIATNLIFYDKVLTRPNARYPTKEELKDFDLNLLTDEELFRICEAEFAYTSRPKLISTITFSLTVPTFFRPLNSSSFILAYGTLYNYSIFSLEELYNSLGEGTEECYLNSLQDLLRHYPDEPFSKEILLF